MELATQDIVLASTLRVLGHRLERIEKVGNKGIFHFSDVTQAEVDEFDMGNTRVEPSAFNAAIKSLTTASRRIL